MLCSPDEGLNCTVLSGRDRKGVQLRTVKESTNVPQERLREGIFVRRAVSIRCEAERG